MDNIVRILAPFAASENGKYNSPRKKLYCVWQLPTGVYVANHYMVIKINIPCETQCININLKCHEKFSVIPLKRIEPEFDFFADNDILVNDGHKQYLKAIFNKPPDMETLLQNYNIVDITETISINIIDTLKLIPKDCEFVVLNNTVFNSTFFVNLLKMFKKLGDKKIDIIFRDSEIAAVEFMSDKVDAFLMPMYHLDILIDMEQKHKENNNSVVYL